MQHHPLSRVSGSQLCLRLITPDDAAYVYGLRTNPDYNAHLSSVTGTAEDQRQWIEAYKAREQAGSECYYIIERLDDGEPCGVVRLYDITGDSFTWGSWILAHNKPAKAALESAYLIYCIAFDVLGLQRAVFDVRLDNVKAMAFHLRFSATQTHSDAINAYFTFNRLQFEEARAQLIKQFNFPPAVV